MDDALRMCRCQGKVGDGKIFVLDLAAAQRVRTGETGDAAL